MKDIQAAAKQPTKKTKETYTDCLPAAQLKPFVAISVRPKLCDIRLKNCIRLDGQPKITILKKYKIFL